MFINISARQHIGRRSDFYDMRDKWNTHFVQQAEAASGIPVDGSANGRKFLLRTPTVGTFISGYAIDANRNWTTPYQDIVIEFSVKCQDAALTPGGTATGHTILIGGVAQTTNYQSGSGTGTWVLRVPVAIKNGDVITYSYDQSTGNTTDVDLGTEIGTVTGLAIFNALSKRIRFTLKKADNTLAANETIKLSVQTYNSGTVDTDATTSAWMTLDMKATPTTDSGGIVDIKYTGNSAQGAGGYITVIRSNASPSESFVWNDTIK